VKWVLGMVAGCVGSWIAVFVVSPDDSRAVFYGMCGPLVAVAGTWMLIEHVARTNPAGLTALMMTGFIAKMAFFAVYVITVLRGLDVEWTPFAVSFGVYFVALYAVEALLLRRLVARLT